jgi:AbiTii-like protein
MVASATSETRMHIPFPEEITAKLNKHHGTTGWNCDLVVAPNELARIIDKVRNLVLDWALNLQKAGIMGSEVSFNEAEKEKAHAASTTINIGSIGTMAGNIGQGNISGNNTIRMEQVQSILDQLKPHVSTLSAEGAGETLGERIAALENAIKQRDPDVSAVRGFMIDLRNTLTGAAGNLIASGAVSALNVILGTGVPA